VILKKYFENSGFIAATLYNKKNRNERKLGLNAGIPEKNEEGYWTGRTCTSCFIFNWIM
jgi:hypothetical protein